MNNELYVMQTQSKAYCFVNFCILNAHLHSFVVRLLRASLGTQSWFLRQHKNKAYQQFSVDRVLLRQERIGGLTVLFMFIHTNTKSSSLKIWIFLSHFYYCTEFVKCKFIDHCSISPNKSKNVFISNYLVSLSQFWHYDRKSLHV